MYPISFFWSNLFQNFYFPLNWEEFFIFHPILKPKEEVFQFVNFVNFSDKIVSSKILSPLRFQMKRKISWVMVSSVPVNMVFWIFRKTFLKKNSCSWNLVPLIFHSQNYRFRGLYHQNTSKMGFYSARRFPSLLLAREINRMHPKFTGS